MLESNGVAVAGPTDRVEVMQRREILSPALVHCGCDRPMSLRGEDAGQRGLVKGNGVGPAFASNVAGR